jgi:hypothetical protein
MESTIYVITHYAFNHAGKNRLPIDQRFIKSKKNFVYYLIDDHSPDCLKNHKTIYEKEVDAQLALAGKKHFAEWAFLLAEAKHGFCNYPFFMISSRFYQKNHWLKRDLDSEWENLFKYLNFYGYGYLPSYDRDLRWYSMEWEKKSKNKAWRYQFFPFTEKLFLEIEKLYGINIDQEYSKVSDFFCNYIGFKDRTHLLNYVNFYQTLISHYFNEELKPKLDLAEITRRKGNYQNEKPFTFVLEWFSHLYFFKHSIPFFALHYDGYYEVNEHLSKFKKLEKIDMPYATCINRKVQSAWSHWKKDGFLAPYRYHYGRLKKFFMKNL